MVITIMLKKGRKNNQYKRAQNIRWIGMTSLIAVLISGIVISILFINHFSDHMVWTNVFLQFMVTCITLLLALVCIALLFLLKWIVVKMALGFFAGLFLLSALFSIVTAIQLLQDKELYEQGKYEIIIGKPTNIDYNRPKNSDTTYVDSFEIDGIKIRTSHLSIDRIDFDLHLKNKTAVVKYLPNSSYALNLF